MSEKKALNVLVIIGLLGVGYVAFPHINEWMQKHQRATENERNRQFWMQIDNPQITPLNGVVLPNQDNSLEQRIAAGKYASVFGSYPWIRPSSFFPLTLPPGPRQLVLIYPYKYASPEMVERWAKDHGYEMARIDDLLAVGGHTDYREFQLQFDIVALGTTWADPERLNEGIELVPYLGKTVGFNPSRMLSAMVGDTKSGSRQFSWDSNARFLLVRKLK